MIKEKTIYSTESHLLRDWMRQKRQQSGLSIRGVAAKLQWPHSIVGKMETGDRRIDFVEFLCYCEAVGADASEAQALVINKIREKIARYK